MLRGRLTMQPLCSTLEQCQSCGMTLEVRRDSQSALGPETQTQSDHAGLFRYAHPSLPEVVRQRTFIPGAFINIRSFLPVIAIGTW